MQINNISYSTKNRINSNNSKAGNVGFEAKFIKNPADLATSIGKKENSVAQRLLNSLARVLNNMNPKAEDKILKNGGSISKKNIFVDSYIPGIDDKPKTIIHINSHLPKHHG